MELEKADIEGLFREGVQYRIPLFQRHYVWNEAGQWDPLWEDIKKNIAKHDGNGEKQEISSHFTGAIVVQRMPNSPSKAVTTYEIIDGQQRLTTFQVVLCALRDSCESISGEVQKFFLNLHTMDSSSEKYKLVPTEFDEEALQSLIDPEKLDPNYEVSENLLLCAYRYFKDRIREFTDGDEGRLRSLLRCVLKDFQFVSIVIDNDDEPEMIFESLNGRGQPLLQFDLLRNNLFLRARREDGRDELYKKYWKHFESSHWDKETTVGRNKIALSELFLQHFLNAKLAKEKVTPLFRVYRKEYSEEFMKNEGVEKELKELRDCSNVYLHIADPNEKSEIASAVKVYHDLDITSLRPFILYLLTEIKLSSAIQKHVFKALEAYTMRRLLCEFRSKDFNKFFPRLITELRKKGFSAKNFLSFLDVQNSRTRRWPKDHEVKDIFAGPIGIDKKTNFVRYILYQIENSMRKNRYTESNNLDLEGLTLEHILPHAWRKKWELPLSSGDFIKFDKLFTDEHKKSNPLWDEDMLQEGLLNESYVDALECAKERDRLLNSFGNLTLLTNSLNVSVSNNSFVQKKEELQKYTTLFLNKEICNQDSWDVSQIEARTEDLYKKFCEIWPDAKWFLDNIPPE